MMIFFGTRLRKILIWQKFSGTWESDFKEKCLAPNNVIYGPEVPAKPVSEHVLKYYCLRSYLAKNISIRKIWTFRCTIWIPLMWNEEMQKSWSWFLILLDPNITINETNVSDPWVTAINLKIDGFNKWYVARFGTICTI